jgi:hypothetical protein
MLGLALATEGVYKLSLESIRLGIAPQPQQQLQCEGIRVLRQNLMDEGRTKLAEGIIGRIYASTGYTISSRKELRKV